ncbi:MAG TPA: hemerythrin domain-containing protein [Kofleriaceae bacterium]
MGIIRRILGQETTSDVLDVLTSHHDRVDELFEQIEKSAKGGQRTAAFTELADLLAAHATVEEKIFYPSVMTKDTTDQLHESVEEHLGMKRLLADLIVNQVDEATFKAKIKVLKEQVSHHAHKEEEAKLFPKVKAMLGADERAAIGNEVLVMFEELIVKHPMNKVPSETAEAAPLPNP